MKERSHLFAYLHNRGLPGIAGAIILRWNPSIKSYEAAAVRSKKKGVLSPPKGHVEVADGLLSPFSLLRIYFSALQLSFRCFLLPLYRRTIKREVKEEVGIDVAQDLVELEGLRFLDFDAVKGIKYYQAYLCRNPHIQLSTSENSHECVWVPLVELDCLRGIRHTWGQLNGDRVTFFKSHEHFMETLLYEADSRRACE